MSYLNVVRSQSLLNGFRAISWYFSDLKTVQLILANAGIPLELLYESQLTHLYQAGSKANWRALRAITAFEMIHDSL
jgi:hypothetical protein